MTVGKLPVIRNISLVNSDDFIDRKLYLGDEEKSGGIARVGLIYKYDDKRTFCLTCPNDNEAFFSSNGVEEETYAKSGQRVGTGKNVMKFYLNCDNKKHMKFYECLNNVCAVVKKKIEKNNGGDKVSVKLRGLYDIIDDDKNVTGHAISARLIESNAGQVFTAAYNDDEQVDIKNIGRCTARPGLIFSYTIPEDEKNYRINISVAQIYYKTRLLFPLRDAN